MTRSRAERLIGHKGTEIRSLLPSGGRNGESSAMGETLTVQCYVKDEGLRIVNFFTREY